MNEMVHKVAIGLGSNLEPRRENMQRAVEWLAQSQGCRLMAVSSLYSSSPWRCEEEAAAFLNAVIIMQTAESPQSMLTLTQSLEKRADRSAHRSGNPTRPYLSRILDLDILLVGNLEVDSVDLIVPHPQLHRREFVLRPLCEIAPDWHVPPGGKTIRNLLNDLKLEEPECHQVEGANWASCG
jgi:2-amino-4-hydroxy-6-hydroxymethyldihydropteridine diphosphokinase